MATAVVFVDVTLADPAVDEEPFLAWWADAEALLRARGRLERALLAVVGRGVYAITLEFPLAGGWGVVSADRPWKELEARRPRGAWSVREARVWHREGVRALATTTVARWLDERAAGTRDFALVDALPEKTFVERRLPGAVNLPAAEVDEGKAAAAIGPDKGRAVVIYCAHYG